MSMLVMLNLNSCLEVHVGTEASRSAGARRRDWIIMAIQVFLFICLLLLADAQKWPEKGSCLPCECYYKSTGLGWLRTVNCSQRGIIAIPKNLPNDLMALDLSRNVLDVSNLRQHLCQFKSLQSLTLSFTEITYLSDILKECTSLLELNLTGNRLGKLDPESFQSLENLRRLLGLEVESILSDNVFKELKNLHDLDLIFHGGSLPSGLFDDTVIQSLNLVLTQARSLPKGIFRFGQKTLNILQLVGENITKLPDDLLDGLYVLKKLFLVMPSVSKLPESFFQSFQLNKTSDQPVTLQEVEISGIQSIPPKLFNHLTSLETLRLKGIRSFPQDGFLEGMVNLHTLVITDSILATIPKVWFSELYSLWTLILSGDQLETLHDDAFKGLLKLNYLDLSNNDLNHITGRMLQPVRQTLETLILTGNFLSEISDDCMRGLHALRFLDISDNIITKINANSFAGFNYLSVLYINNNRLTSLPKDLFRDQLQLESITIASNYLTEFPKAVLKLTKSLVNIDLSFNAIREVPVSELCKFQYLKMVDITENQLYCDCNFFVFKKCPQITFQGQCKTPVRYADRYFSDIEIPRSCEDKVKQEPLHNTNTESFILATSALVVPRSKQTQVEKEMDMKVLQQSLNTSAKQISKSTGKAQRDGLEYPEETYSMQTLVPEVTGKESNIAEKPNMTVIRALFTEEYNDTEVAELDSNKSLPSLLNKAILSLDKNAGNATLDEPATLLKSWTHSQSTNNADLQKHVGDKSNQEIGVLSSVTKAKDKQVRQQLNIVNSTTGANIRKYLKLNTTYQQKHTGVNVENVAIVSEGTKLYTSVQDEKLQLDTSSIQSWTHSERDANVWDTTHLKVIQKEQQQLDTSSTQPWLNIRTSGNVWENNKLKSVQKTQLETSSTQPWTHSEVPANGGESMKLNIKQKPKTLFKAVTALSFSFGTKSTTLDAAQEFQQSDLASDDKDTADRAATVFSEQNKPNQVTVVDKTYAEQWVKGKREYQIEVSNYTDQTDSESSTSKYFSASLMHSNGTLTNTDNLTEIAQSTPIFKKTASSPEILLINSSANTVDKMSANASGENFEQDLIHNSAKTDKMHSSSKEGVKNQNTVKSSTSTSHSNETPPSTVILTPNIGDITLAPYTKEKTASRLKDVENVTAALQSSTVSELFTKSVPADNLHIVSENIMKKFQIVEGEGYPRQNGQEINTDFEETDRTPEKLAFNFTISALVALFLFGCALLAIYALRRWQHKGTYIVHNQDCDYIEMDLMVCNAMKDEDKTKNEDETKESE